MPRRAVAKSLKWNFRVAPSIASDSRDEVPIGVVRFFAAMDVASDGWATWSRNAA